MEQLNGISINTRTEKELNELLEFYDKHGVTWASSRRVMDFNPYPIHKEGTCIVLHDNVITYECVGCHQYIERKLILFNELKGDLYGIH